MDWTLYYNPKCGTCRKVKDRLEAKGVTPRIVEYLKTPPTVEELEGILKKLGAGPEAITRFKEPLWDEKGRDGTLPRRDWLRLIADNPVLLQRPIVVRGDKAILARPPEKVDDLFK
jgi:arsenate reductase (glutaredoxin)